MLIKAMQMTTLPPDDLQKEPNKPSGTTSWWGRNKASFAAMAMIVTPTLLVSSTVPDAFSAATDIAVSQTWKAFSFKIF